MNSSGVADQDGMQEDNAIEPDALLAEVENNLPVPDENQKEADDT